MFSFDADEDLFPILDQDFSHLMKNPLKRSAHELVLEEDESQALKQDFTPSFFQGIMVPIEHEPKRRAAVQRILELLTLSLYDPERKLIKAHIGRIVALSRDCPFDYVRNKFTHFLTTNREEIEEKVGPVPRRETIISAFFPSSECVPISTADPLIKKMFQASFLQSGNVDHVCRVLAWHPTYYEKYIEAMHFIMDARDGPLPRDARHYIAIMAASRWKIRYIVEDQERKFLESKGDPNWLKGVSNSPKKYRNLLELNAVMAHTPWLVNESLVLKVLTGEDAWTISELVHIFLIMASLRGIALFVAAIGIVSEGTNCPVQMALHHTHDHPVLDVVAKLRQGVRSCQDSLASPQAQLALFSGAAASDGTEVVPVEERCANWPYELELRYQNCFSHITYSEYNVHSGDHLRNTDYNWNTHGYAIVKRYHSVQCANLLAETFETAYTVTYKSFHNTVGVDTTPFRRAIWYYVHRVHGIFHDDYDYAQVNEWLSIKLKKYIKKMCCYPYQIVAEDLDLDLELHSSEVAHIALLVMESRKQAELIYGLRVIAKYTTKNEPICQVKS